MTRGETQEGDIPTKTTAEAYAEGLEIGKRLMIDDVRATLVGEHPDRGKQPPIRPQRTRIKGVTIDGCKLEIVLSEEPFSSKPTLDDLSAAYEGDDAYFKKHGCQFLPTGLPVRSSKKRKIPQARGIVIGTIVKSMAWRGTPPVGATIEGHMVHVSGLGRIYFGELLVSDLSRRLTMVRAKLGSDVGGELAAVEVETNGRYLACVKPWRPVAEVPQRRISGLQNAPGAFFAACEISHGGQARSLRGASSPASALVAGLLFCGTGLLACPDFCHGLLGDGRAAVAGGVSRPPSRSPSEIHRDASALLRQGESARALSLPKKVGSRPKNNRISCGRRSSVCCAWKCCSPRARPTTPLRN